MAALSAAASAGGLLAPDSLPGLPPVPTSNGGPRPGQPPAFGGGAFAETVRNAARDDAAELTVAEAARRIRDGDLSPVDLLEALLERIDRLEPVYMAFNEVDRDAAREEARRLAGSEPGGPLHGIPLAVKDNFYTAGLRTTASSLVYEDFVPDFDATAVARLRRAGAVILGKTQMGPLATTRATTPEGEVTTVNAWAPHSPGVSPGGSSSGTATAVAGRLAPAGTGTQTGGSITVPSTAQGLTGVKPTLGRVSLYGVIPLTYTRDHPGPMARDARDAAILLQAMAGPDRNDPRTLGLPPVPDLVEAAAPVRGGGRTALRWPTVVGVPPGYADGDSSASAARRRMLAAFEDLGARVVEVKLPDGWDELGSRTFNAVRLPERSEPFLEHLKRDVRLFGVSLSNWINGLLLSGDEYLKGQRARLLLLTRVLDDLFRQCDVVLQPSHLPFDMIGLPLAAFPIGMREGDEGERPVGAILGGPPFSEDRLLSLVGAYQDVTDWHQRRPAEPDPGASPSPPEPGARRGGRGRIRAEEVMELSE